MKVCLVGDNSYPLDEGMKKTTASLVNVISNYCDTIVLNPLKATDPSFWTSLIRFKPEIIHYVPGPSLQSFVLLRAMGLLTSAKTVMSVTHPDPNLPVKIAKTLKPDLILVQSKRTEQVFKDLGKRSSFLPNGVDTNRFQPVSSLEKNKLRQKYGVAEDAFIILHVGNTRGIRNLDVLQELNGNDAQVVIVSSTTIQGSKEVNDRLRSVGCKIIDYYVESIEEIYQLADFYIFPTVDHQGAIEHPLSVMEAMACNMYVGATKFGALPRMFQEGKGIYFYQSFSDLANILGACRKTLVPAETRELVLPFTWDSISLQLIDLYNSI